MVSSFVLQTTYHSNKSLVLLLRNAVVFTLKTNK